MTFKRWTPNMYPLATSCLQWLTVTHHETHSKSKTSTATVVSKKVQMLFSSLDLLRRVLKFQMCLSTPGLEISSQASKFIHAIVESLQKLWQMAATKKSEKKTAIRLETKWISRQ